MGDIRGWIPGHGAHCRVGQQPGMGVAVATRSTCVYVDAHSHADSDSHTHAQPRTDADGYQHTAYDTRGTRLVPTDHALRARTLPVVSG